MGDTSYLEVIDRLADGIGGVGVLAVLFWAIYMWRVGKRNGGAVTLVQIKQCLDDLKRMWIDYIREERETHSEITQLLKMHERPDAFGFGTDKLLTLVEQLDKNLRENTNVLREMRIELRHDRSGRIED